MDTLTRLPAATARLLRRTSFGARTTDTAGVAGVTELASLTPTEVVERLLAGPTGDPWGDTSYAVGVDDRGPVVRRAAAAALDAWIQHAVRNEIAFDDWLTWCWHGHFVSALQQARNPQLMVEQWRLFRRSRAGTFAELVRAVTIDPAMLLYLDGNRSTGSAPNENYSRELLELFTIGIGEYTEADVAAGARALSGWRLRPGETTARFVPERHDDTPQRYLGVDDVHDLDTVVAAVAAHPALPRAIAERLAHEIVGPAADPAVIEAAALAFRDTGGSIDAVLRTLMLAVANGADGGPIVSAPLPWALAAMRATGTALSIADLLAPLRAAGQVPWAPPNVSGWPSGAAWSNAATVIARLQLSTLVAAAADAAHPVLTAVDLDELAVTLGLAEPFGTTTVAALAPITDPRARLALALTTPEFVLV